MLSVSRIGLDRSGVERIGLGSDSFAESDSEGEVSVLLAKSPSAISRVLEAEVSRTFSIFFELALGFFLNPIHAQFSGLPASFML